MYVYIVETFSSKLKKSNSRFQNHALIRYIFHQNKFTKSETKQESKLIYPASKINIEYLSQEVNITTYPVAFILL